ncbi:MAG: hypothetical protein JSU86_10045 [Phycisphaerales bacterium]|nr:MAG: hypothetical protein JSU86_10045 [Phycisphaerales bacterium]
MFRPAGRLALSVGALVMAAFLVGCAGPRDYFVTSYAKTGGGTYRDIALPAGFFGPGTEAFKGRVELVGNPLNPAKTGSADSILERSADPIRARDPVGKSRTVRLRLVALSLMSKDPITIMSQNGPQQWQIHVGLSKKRAPTGSLTATKTHANGGTFDSKFYCPELLTFISVENPSKTLVLDMGDKSEPLEFSGTGTPFVIKEDPKMRLVRTSGSSFVPAVAQRRLHDPDTLIDMEHRARLAAHLARRVRYPGVLPDDIIIVEPGGPLSPR